MNAALLDRFQTRLRDLRADLVSELKSDADAIAQDIRAPGDSSDVPNHPADEDSEGVAERVALAQLERDTIELIDGALHRIQAGNFGQCENCGRGIPPERLDAIPYTTYCIDCAREREAAIEPDSGR
jgi:RNA polymerase-binding protein DksA